ncbi:MULTISPECIES: hypothetical protein [Microcystis]|jgi:hypothetical protein|uniref:Uncharacterized protein n=3 Tax=Microcystis TaxID=1125 RepID=A0A552QBB2_9CHRO|nr:MULTISPECIES: hypothetical protein [Microcystis]REJ38567.1 MAG: hypothetical protein DWQ54_25615 [Microcystis flos-aquae TF09]TRV47677.1 MAG: hypothetical protein EWV43_12170 [Microcystis panniformis Mp_MB_F_20080800_S26D]TRV49333.1 MAG: hypothetical protein EWV87_10505 [Microcystis panniformis Mp_GB_SS_20050300_S99]TRV52997.1 MAG: hypothetical protein EWV42_07010 [Microcystis panniformis Mp_GB_SS_20050300_S99D]TRV63459.1 MAG: hypothetical protein EWV69_03645 [Microcystis panniformis Mp_MB_
MSASLPQEPFSPLGKLVSVIGLLAIALYFTGWIYRWFYFGFFQVDLTTLNLPLESFYIASFSLLFRSPWAILKTIIAIGVAILGMVMTFKAIAILGRLFHQPLQKAAQRLGLTANQNYQLQFLASLLDEVIIVLWLFLVLYFLARGQGYADARRDALNETSTLPAITIAMKGEDAVIGRKLDKLLENPSSVRIFGDRTRYDGLLGNELNQNPTIWRLLSDANGHLYVFPSLNAKNAGNRVPPVLIFPDSGKGDRLTILSPAKSF